jgi:hypothetical protein
VDAVLYLLVFRDMQDNTEQTVWPCIPNPQNGHNLSVQTAQTYAEVYTVVDNIEWLRVDENTEPLFHMGMFGFVDIKRTIQREDDILNTNRVQQLDRRIIEDVRRAVENARRRGENRQRTTENRQRATENTLRAKEDARRTLEDNQHTSSIVMITQIV